MYTKSFKGDLFHSMSCQVFVRSLKTEVVFNGAGIKN